MKPLAKLIGQPLAVELLERAIAINRIAPAYLFVGAKGVGKGYGARCFAEMLMIRPEDDYAAMVQKIQAGNHPDFLWVQPTYTEKGELITVSQAQEQGLKRKNAPQIRIEQIRAISEFLGRPPLKAPRSVVVIEDAELMAESAGNALLKTLEEPGRATIILIAPSVDAILSTLVSRCQMIPFSRLGEDDLAYVLQRQNAADVLEYPQLITLAQGSPGKAMGDRTKLLEIPSDLLSRLSQLPLGAIEGFHLAKEISESLELDTQLWLADYLQCLYWDKQRNKEIVEGLEKVKRALKSYVQPRLVWDCFYLHSII
ncbi:DNA polymerase III subunit delta' [Cyanobacterium sp. IPPAS B-1200]|uniref:DNA polymerase III subunit delta' n=1 Tax=Cyanobacterium sp. IPPAS B-1200 TaxID=1562720 RepID=UPI0008525C2C|nr:DNA polymerase III subunit delta' [Cyanobacterium sp. IPPAS B-1200]OEJ79658.1 DNA polymerase III subunit delta' [Cyanobacterium sp. IPPAS B-1200]